MNDTTSDDPFEHAMTNSLEEMNEILEEYYTRTSNRFAIVNYKGMKEPRECERFVHIPTLALRRDPFLSYPGQIVSLIKSNGVWLDRRF